ncbi:MAG: hypothetical protein WCZ18_02955 [Ottowia sp.]|nr:hypothetical protein [Ottowia sp.]
MTSPGTDVWLADDDDDHLVHKECGTPDTNPLPGEYVVEFRLGMYTYPIHPWKDSEYTQVEIQAGPICPRPEINMATPYTAKQGQYLAFVYHFMKIHGQPPPEAEMQRYFQVTPPSVHQMVLALGACRTLVQSTAPVGQAVHFCPLFRYIAGLCASKSNKTVLAFPLGSLRSPKPDRLLESKGLIARTPGKGRSIRLLLDRSELPDLE